MEEPAIDMAIPSYLVSRAARETLRVMLSGMGGDEVFAGYPRQLAMKLAGAFDPVPGTAAAAGDARRRVRCCRAGCPEN